VGEEARQRWGVFGVRGVDVSGIVRFLASLGFALVSNQCQFGIAHLWVLWMAGAGLFAGGRFFCLLSVL